MSRTLRPCAEASVRGARPWDSARLIALVTPCVQPRLAARSRPRHLPRALLLAGALAGAVLGLAGCAGDGTVAAANDRPMAGATSSGERSGTSPANPSYNGSSVLEAGRPDLVTASDESDAAKRSRIRLELASAYFAEGKTSTALDEVKIALAANPSNVPAFNLRGLIYATLGERALAEDSFRRALALQPGDGDTLHNYGWYLCNQRQWAAAREQFRAALAQPSYRDRAKTLLAQGVCEARSGDLGAAEKTLQGSFELDPANPATAVNLAEVLLRRGDVERARFYVQRVNKDVQLANAETLWLAARIEHRRGNTAAVDDLGNQLRSRYPGSPQASAFDQGQFDR